MHGHKAPCRKCGEWFTTDHGMFISRPHGWDPSLCPKCNHEINARERMKSRDLAQWPEGLPRNMASSV